MLNPDEIYNVIFCFWIHLHHPLDRLTSAPSLSSDIIP